eukprot:Seg2944.3 transcript_id=Seg2944.3/GoldUCD/mRNA.D3Y31 product="hypothetical protein" protein_id=Seg2944.3/GoldUCD/D3Y31
MAGRENKTMQDNILQTVILPGVTSFQALFRGYRTRKVLAVVRDEFCSIYDEIEGENACENSVGWRGTFGRPKIRPGGAAKSGAWYERSVDSGKELECMDIISTDSEKERFDKRSTTKQQKKRDKALVRIQNETGNNFEPESSTLPENEIIRDDDSMGSSAQANSNVPQLARDIQHEVTQKDEATGYRDSELEPERDIACQALEIKDSFSDSILQPKVSAEEASGRTFADGSMPGSTPNEHLSTECLHSLNKNEILQKKKELQMELLWIQQAIESRKQYIKLKG